MNRVQSTLRQPSFIFHLSSFILLLVAGCHGVKQAAVTEVPGQPDTTEAPAATPTRVYTVVNFTGEVAGVSVNGQLRMAQDSVMWLSVYKFIEVARGLATPDSVWLRSSLLGIDRGADYGDLRQRLHRHISYNDLQTLALADDAEERISQLARQLGFDATVHITRRQQVPALTFPYSKPKQ
ncbi:MAG: DUF4292 domain-containing protein [Bacteroidales bacterium]|nr:DUF4292 domain-containing protein [Bacteroidales bacterium]